MRWNAPDSDTTKNTTDEKGRVVVCSTLHCPTPHSKQAAYLDRHFATESVVKPSCRCCTHEATTCRVHVENANTKAERQDAPFRVDVMAPIRVSSLPNLSRK